MLLDVTGILFAAQLVLLLTIGPYADYGNWRPWIMISKPIELRRCSVTNAQLHSCPVYLVHLPVCHVRYQPTGSVASRTSPLRGWIPG